MQRLNVRWIAVGIALIAFACGVAGKTATATIESKSSSTTTGTATFTQDGPNITLKVQLEGAPPGQRAAHLHAFGDCSGPNGLDAGGHWNPESASHGKWGTGTHHLGDIGNITVGADGKGSVQLTTNRWTIESAAAGGTNNVVGHSIIIHGGTDDYVSQPVGDAGNRIGCGVITLQ